MVYGGEYPNYTSDNGGGYFLHIMGSGKGLESMDKMTTKRKLTSITPSLKLLDLSSSWYQDLTGKKANWITKHQVSSPRYVTRRSLAQKVLLPDRTMGRETPGISSPRLRIAGNRQPLHSPQLRKASGRDNPWVPPRSPLVHVKAGLDSPLLSGRIEKTSRRPKKSVHWKTNIATWIQMNANPSSMSFSEVSNYESDWGSVDGRRSSEGGNDTSDDDGTMRFNTAGKSVCCASTGKEEDSSDFEYTNFSQDDEDAEKVYYDKNVSRSATLEAHGESRYLTPRKFLPPPVPPPVPDAPNEDSESHYYSEFPCSCSCSVHTYECLDDGEEQRCCSESSISSIHTYCEIDEVNRGSKPEVLATLLRNDHRLDVLKSTLVHLLPKDDIISTTLLACRLGDLEYLQDLNKQRRLNASARDLQGASCLHYAARGGHDHILRFLLEEGRQRGVVRCDVGATPLHDAAALGHITTLKYLNKHCKNALLLTDKDGASVLHVAAR